MIGNLLHAFLYFIPNIDKIEFVKAENKKIEIIWNGVIIEIYNSPDPLTCITPWVTVRGNRKYKNSDKELEARDNPEMWAFASIIQKNIVDRLLGEQNENS